jgi:hypothetical protein
MEEFNKFDHEDEDMKKMMMLNLLAHLYILARLGMVMVVEAVGVEVVGEVMKTVSEMYRTTSSSRFFFRVSLIK